MKFLQIPQRSYLLGATLTLLLFLSLFGFEVTLPLLFFAIVGSLPVLIKATKDVFSFKISIEVFNTFVLIVAFLIADSDSAAFIVLMLTFADYLDFITATRAHGAVEELLKLNPVKATIEKGGILKEIDINKIIEGDIIFVKKGDRVPVDGVVISGKAFLNEASVSGESMPVEKITGDTVFSSTLNEVGFIKIKATGVGKNSTIERIAGLIQKASLHKSKQEKMADSFAEIFLPSLLILGGVTYYFTQDLSVVVSLFLVACADDMAVAIPLAMTASLGRAARRGVIIKGGEWLDALANTKTIVFDKTGTLTYGTLAIQSVHVESGFEESFFWERVGVAEKYSEHSIGRAIFREANKRIKEINDPDFFESYNSKGVMVSYKGDVVAVGNEDLFADISITLNENALSVLERERKEHKNTTSLVYINKKFAGVITVADVVHPEAKKSIESLRILGIETIKMFTGDSGEIARTVSGNLGITDINFKMTPETKLLELEKISKENVVAMVGDGINDAPSLARADVGIVMGNGSSAVAVEAADVIVLTNNLNRIPEMIELGRKTQSIIKVDIIIWVVTNLVGFALVFTGVIGPVLAAFYNFATDFFPLINSSRLFREKI
ncbi:MAG: Heavy metal translocating P-type ATPase [Parcubacteria group bacterium GW2011_GWF2_38_76]|nr:MAG: Heavy metal translocating P-type ATPase [Parcubacteria group bacterium GW2011_GWF2_38_76]HBM45625.1 hypothetical protein [Patescibacteria group bacterium]